MTLPFEKKKVSWDRRIPFEHLSRKFMDDLNLFIAEWYRKKRKKNISKQLVYLTILLIQLYNGLRISEAIEGFKRWIITGNKEVQVKVRKRKDDEYRVVLIPDVISFNRTIIEKAIDLGFGDINKIEANPIKKWSIETYDINTHTLRKAWESYMARNLGKDLALITAWQGRKTVESHLVYLRREEAKEDIKKLLDNIFK